VIAEGIENAAQLQFLQEKDCHFVQGFFLGPPAAAAGSPQAGLEAESHPVATQAANLGPLAAKPSLLMTQR
jgi:EAL domain-containing protein (putative c-di-GMP-specific phosphodiesterase class I)